MPNYNVTNNIDTLLRSTSNAAARTNLGLGDAATKNTGTTAGTVAAGDDSRITGAVQTTRTVSAGTGLTGGGDLSANRTISANVGTTAGTLAAGDDSRITGAVQTSRTISAGTGLTGGGDLSANRTLSVSFGSTAGTACEGNDARLSNSRTPTAHAATHGAAGSDPITITSAQISGSLTQNTTGTASNVTGTVAAANGGTGQTAYTNGQLLIGNATGGLTKATLTAGANVTITNGDGAITIAATGGGGGSGTVTSVDVSGGTTGLTTSGGPVTGSGTITLAGTLAVANGGTGSTTAGAALTALGAVAKAGDTMTGKLTLGAGGTTAPVNLGAATAPVSPATGDLWLAATNVLNYRGYNSATYPIASTASLPSFTAGVSTAIGSSVTPALAVQQNGAAGAMTVANTASATSDCVTITNLGTGNSLVVNDETTPDSTRFAIANNGRVGIGVAPDASVALAVDSTGIKFNDGTTQTTAAVAGVSSFSAGTTGLTPATGTTGAVTLAGTLAIANGGTGQTTRQAAMDALAGATTSGQYLRGNGTDVVMSAIQAGDVPTLNQNTTGTASNVTGTVAIANGGTGSTTAANAINALLPSQTGNSGKVLTTNGSVASWGTAGSSGITALVGDVTATGPGSSLASVVRVQGRNVSSTAPIGGQVLGWNASTNQWEPTSAGGSVSYEVLRVFIGTPGSGTYIVPSGYKYANIIASSGGGGGGAGAYTSGGSVSGGGGGANGILMQRRNLLVQNAQISYIIGSGGAGGQRVLGGYGGNGASGTGTLVEFAFLPTGGSGNPTLILDLAYQINSSGLSTQFGQGGGNYASAAGYIGTNVYQQNLQSGGSGSYGGNGSQASTSVNSQDTTYTSAGGGGGGIDSGGNPFDGGNILDQNYILYTGGVQNEYQGKVSGTLDASSVDASIFNFFYGGAGGAAGTSSQSIFDSGLQRAGNGANGSFGCGGGGGGSMYDSIGNSSIYVAGNGGNGGDGFLLMYLYK